MRIMPIENGFYEYYLNDNTYYVSGVSEVNKSNFKRREDKNKYEQKKKDMSYKKKKTTDMTDFGVGIHFDKYI